MTGFQIRNDWDYRAYVVYGNIKSYAENDVGKIAYIPQDEVVLYSVSNHRKHRGWLVSTKAGANADSNVPGIFSPVVVYAEVRGRGRVNRLIKGVKYYHNNLNSIKNIECFLSRLESVVRQKIYNDSSLKDLHRRCGS